MSETQSSGGNESALEQNAFALPKHGRHRSVSAERSVDPSSAIAPSRHRHTQSVSSVHAVIPPPVYTARSQPIGLSRSTSLSSGGHALDPSASSVDESGTVKPKSRRASLHRSESLPAFPPDKSREQADVRRRESVSLDELATLPANPKSWLPSHLSLYLSATLSLPRPLRADITSFVASSSLTGRTFLHLREADLDEIGTNILWRRALLSARDELNREAHGGRTFWGFEGPGIDRTDLEGSKCVEGKILRRPSDAGSLTSEDGRAKREDWKRSLRRLGAGQSLGKVQGLRQAFEHAADEETPQTTMAGRPAEQRPPPSLQVDRQRSSSFALSPLELATQSTEYRDEEPAFDADQWGSLELDLNSPHDRSLDGSSDRNLPPSPPQPRRQRAPLPFLTGSGLVHLVTREAHGGSATSSRGRAQRGSVPSVTGPAFWERDEPIGDSNAQSTTGTPGAPEFDEEDIDTIRPVKSPEPTHAASSPSSPSTPAGFPGLAGLFDLDMPRSSPPSRSSQLATAAPLEQEEGRTDDRLVTFFVPNQRGATAVKDDLEATARAKKGSLVLVRKSQFAALQRRMVEVEAELAAVLAKTSDQEGNDDSAVAAIEAEEADLSWQFKGEEIDAEQLLQLDAQMKSLETSAKTLVAVEAPEASASERMTAAPSLRTSGSEASAVDLPPAAAAPAVPGVPRSRRGSRGRPLAPDAEPASSAYPSGDNLDEGGVWDVGRSGWPHDRIHGWRQLSGYVVAASIGIGIVAGEVVASKLLGLRRR